MAETRVHIQEGMYGSTLQEHRGTDTAAAARRQETHAGIAPGAGRRQAGHVMRGEGSGADSLQAATAPAGDSLAVRMSGDSLTARMPGDSLAFGPLDSAAWNGAGYLFPGDSAAAASEPVVWRDTTAQAVFGVASLRAEMREEEIEVHNVPTDNVPFQCYVLLLAITYAVLLYRNLGDIKTLLNRTFHDAASRKRLSEDTGSSGFSRFLNITTAIGLLFIGPLAVKFGGERIGGLLPDHLEGVAMLGLSLATTLAAGIVVLYQHLVLRSAGAITVSRPFILQLLQLRRTYFALIVVGVAPVLLLFILCPPHSGGIWFHVVLLESAIALILYLKESLSLFLSKNFSILHWFLYLCAVELFPISLLWLSLTRG